MAKKSVAKHGLSILMACVVYSISETCYRYQAKLSGENALVADWLLRLTQTHKHWGFGLCFLYLLNVKGCTWNHKRVYRIYRELELNLRFKPAAIRCDNGPEYISQSLIDWANRNQITLIYIQPGKPTQNACIERFNRTARHEWLDLHQFNSVPHAQLLATQWLWQYNNERPNTAIGGIPPARRRRAA